MPLSAWTQIKNKILRTDKSFLIKVVVGGKANRQPDNFQPAIKFTGLILQ
jgi:hypothetical protein